MAEGGHITYSSGSEIIYDFYCELCVEDGKQLEASGYCTNCKEYLCEECYHGHTKSRWSRHHVLEDKSSMPRDTPLPSDIVNKTIRTMCKSHTEEVVKFYCKVHEVFGCSTCFATEHKRCPDVENILEKSENIFESEEYTSLITKLKSIMIKSEDMLKQSRDNKTLIRACCSDAVCVVRQVKEEAVLILEEVESNIVELAEKLCSESEEQMEILTKEFIDLSERIEIVNSEVESVCSSKRVCQLFIKIKEAEKEAINLQTSLRNAKKKNIVNTFTFEPNPELHRYLKTPDILGKISYEDEGARQISTHSSDEETNKGATHDAGINALSRDLPIEERMTDFLTNISTPDESSFVKTLDVAAFHASLTLTIVYKAKHENHLQPAMACDLFLEDIWITYHSGSTKEDCMVDVYHKAWKILSTKTAKDLLAMKRKMADTDLFGPYMITVYRKGDGQSVDSNATHLKRYGHDLSKVAANRLEDIVLLEHTDWSSDRQKHAIDILNLSCMQNGLLLQWETETLLNNYSTVNASYAVGKAQAKELAFMEALFSLYKKQAVIKMNLQGDQREWITYEQLTREADEMQARRVMPYLPVRDETGVPFSSYITKAAYDKVNRFAEKKKGEIIFAPGMSSNEVNELCYLGRMLNLKCDMRSHEGQQYIVLFKHIEWSKLVSRLSPTAGLYGKYFRVAKEDVPKFALVYTVPMLRKAMTLEPLESE